jgi:hypothetical protein
MNRRSLALGLFVMTGVSIGYAERAPEPLVTGSAPSDVMKVWGEPQEQVEREIKREVEWRYSNGSSVTFREGAVVAWKTRVAASETPTVKIDKPRKNNGEEIKLNSPTKTKKSSDGLDFVREIAKEIPSGSDSPSSGGESPVSPQNDAPPPPPASPPSLVQQLVQPPNGGVQMIEPRGRAPGVIPGPEVYPLDDGEE